MSDVQSFRRRSVLSSVLEPISYSIVGIYVAATILFIATLGAIGVYLFYITAPTIAPFVIIPALKMTFHTDDYDFTIQTSENFQKTENDAKLLQETVK